MYKVLVVDDEPKHRKGLANVIRKYRPDYEVLEARDGLEALSVITSTNVDILITDIRMPNMDGLQLIESMGDRIKSTKVIILSVYGYFEYAQKAISLGAFEYILKPFEESSVDDILKRVEDKIEQERLEMKEKESLAKQLTTALPVYLEHQLNKWIKGNLNKSELEEIEKIFPYKGNGAVIVSEIYRNDSSILNYSNEEIDEIKMNIKYWMKEVIKPLGHSITFFLSEKTNNMVTIINSSKKLNLTSPENVERFKQFINNLKVEYGFYVTLGIGSESDNIFEQVSVSFAHGQTALSYKFYMGVGNVIAYHDIVLNPYKPVLSKYKEEESLADAITQMDKEKSVRIMNDIFDRILSNGHPLPEQLIDSIEHIILKQVKIVENLLQEEEYNKFLMDIRMKLNGCEEYSELRQKVNGILSDIINIQEYKRNYKNDSIIMECKKYIDEHFMDELSLELIAQKFYFNPSYFSCFFKNYTGISFSEYLFNTRMQKAKELLKNTDYKIYEIAVKVGYKDPGYFNRIFKRKFGIAPDEYRRIKRKGV